MKSVIEEIDEDGMLAIKIRIHATENLDEAWMDPVKEMYVDDDGFYHVTKNDFSKIPTPWEMSIPLGQDGKPSGFRPHTDRSAAQHQLLKTRIQNGSVNITFSEDMGYKYQDIGQMVTFLGDNDFFAKTADKSKTTYYSYSKSLLVVRTQTDEGEKVNRFQYTLNAHGQKVPSVITTIVPIINPIGPCLEKVTTKVYSNYEVWNCGGESGEQGLSRDEERNDMRSEVAKDKEALASNTLPYIYPNPTNGNVTLEIPADYNNPIIELFSTNGQQQELLYLNETSSVFQFSTGHLEPGIYFLHLNDASHSKMIKLFIH